MSVLIGQYKAHLGCNEYVWLKWRNKKNSARHKTVAGPNIGISW